MRPHFRRSRRRGDEKRLLRNRSDRCPTGISKKLGRPPAARRVALNAILYALKGGNPWRLPPKNFPLWKTVYHVFRAWSLFEMAPETNQSNVKQTAQPAVPPVTMVTRAYMKSVIVLLSLTVLGKLAMATGDARLLDEPSAPSTAGPLASLYARFLSSGNSNVFVALEQERVFPEPKTGKTQIELGYGRTAQLFFHNKTYLSFGRNGDHFIIGTSRRTPVLERENLIVADELEGFDGSNYWTFRPRNAMQFFRNMEGAAESTLLESLGLLTIIPLEEASREQGIYQSDVILETIRVRLLECINVVQFGYGGELAAPPPRLRRNSASAFEAAT